MSAWTEPCPTRRRLWALALMIYLLALAVRGTVYLESRYWPLFTHPQIDEYTAYEIGLAFIDGKLPREVYLKGPLYMWFVGGVAWLFGRDPMRVRLVQVFLSSLSPALLFLIGNRLFGWRIGLVSGILGATFWTIVYYSLVLVDAAVSTLLYLLLLWVLVSLDDGRRWKWPLCGVILGLGALSRPSVLAFAPILALLIPISVWRKCAQRRLGREGESTSGAAVTGSVSELPRAPEALSPELGARACWWTAAAPVIALALGCCSVVLPVTVRNRVVGREWVLIGAYGGQNLWIANSPRSDGKSVPILVDEGPPKMTPVEPNDVWTSVSFGNRVARYYAERAAGRRLRFGEIDAYFAQIGREWIWNHPKEFLIKTCKRFCFFLNVHEYPNEADIYWFCEASRLLKCLSYVHFGVIAPLAVLGLALAAVRRSWTAPLAYCTAMLASLWLPGLFFVINARFRIVIVPLLILFAAYGLYRLVRLCGRGVPWSHRVATLGGLAALAVFSNINWFGYAEEHYTDHRLAFAAACEAAGRKDLAAAAADRFAEALDQDIQKGRLTQTAMMEHVNPAGWLCFHYFQRANALPPGGLEWRGYMDKAFHYGKIMIGQDVPMPFVRIAYFHAAMNTGHEQDAGRALEIIRREPTAYDPLQYIMCLMRYGEKCSNTSVLHEAARLLELFSQNNPTEMSFHVALERIRRVLSSRAAPATSRATSGQ